MSPARVSSARALVCIAAGIAHFLIASDATAQQRHASASTAHASAANVVIVVAHDFAFDLAPSIPGGLTTFELRNRGAQSHHLEIVRLDSGKTASDALAALLQAARGPRPAWLHSIGGPNAATPGESSNATLVLAPGSYLAFCEIPGPTAARHYMKGMVKPFIVTASGRPGALPPADIALNLVDFDFVLSHPLTRGHHVLAVSNAGSQRHMVAIKRFPNDYPAGTTASYAEIAERIGAPTAARAVAKACAANRLAVAIPCHRVVRSDGALSGYRWGVERKRALLKREST